MKLSSKYRNHSLTAIVTCMLFIGGYASANTTNTVPFEFSFEDVDAGTSIVGTNGWYADAESYAVVTNVPGGYTYSGTHPINTTHTNHVVLDTENGGLTNLFNTTGTADIWIDTMLNPTRWTDDTPPDCSDAEIDIALFVNSNGNPVIYHYTVPNAADGGASWSNDFSVISSVFIAEATWTRVTIQRTEVYGPPAFLIKFDGVGPVTHQNALTPGFANGGSLFLEASYATKGAPGMTSVEFKGTGAFDDFVVANTEPVFSIMWDIIISLNNTLGASTSPQANFTVNNGANTNITITVSNFWDLAEVTTNGISAGTPAVLALENVSAHITVAITVDAQTTQSVGGVNVPKWWLNSYALNPDAPDGDTDGDLILNWMEWLASTDPNDPTSKFEIKDHYIQGGNIYVAWDSKSIDASLPPFRMLRSTNLMEVGGGWLIIDPSVSRPAAPAGTTIWMDPSPPVGNVPVYYRVEATNSP